MNKYLSATPAYNHLKYKPRAPKSWSEKTQSIVERRGKIWRLLAQHSSGLTVKEISDALGVPYTQVSNDLSKMASVNNVDYGLWLATGVSKAWREVLR